MKLAVGDLPTFLAVVVIVGVGGIVYVVTAFRTGVKEADMVLRPTRKIMWR